MLQSFLGFLRLVLFGCSCFLLGRSYDSVEWLSPNLKKFSYFCHSPVDACKL